MANAAVGSEPARERHRGLRIGVFTALGVGVLIAFGIALYGGYSSEHWTWTGFEHAKLWDWLHVLLLPVAFALVAALVREKRLGAWRALIGFTCLALFIVLVVAGYLIPWEWTGFVGNTVWDWLGLVLLPLTLVLLAAVEFDVRSVRGQHVIVILLLLTAIAVLALGGYTQGWAWTGFEGNTLFDWLQLLFLPIVIPLVVIPLVLALRRSEKAEEAGEEARS